jgi:hypothetical protein
MSSTSSGYTPVPGMSTGPRAREEGSGWRLFAGLLMVMAAALNIVSGIAAIDNANFFAHGQDFVISNLNTWGWINLCVGVILAAAAVGTFMRNSLGMMVAIACLMGNAVSQLFFIAAAPNWAIMVFALDLLALYGLIVHGFKTTSD